MKPTIGMIGFVVQDTNFLKFESCSHETGSMIFHSREGA